MRYDKFRFALVAAIAVTCAAVITVCTPAMAAGKLHRDCSADATLAYMITDPAFKIESIKRWVEQYDEESINQFVTIMTALDMLYDPTVHTPVEAAAAVYGACMEITV